MQRPWRLPDKLRRKYETAEALGLTENSATSAGRVCPRRKRAESAVRCAEKQIIRQENECIQDLRKFTTR